MRTIHFRSRGVTLMELLVVILVVGILAAVAVPSYRRYLMRAHRADATTALLRLASAQEKHMLQYGVYITDTASLPGTGAAGLGLSTNSDEAFYDLAVEATATGYNATATANAARGQADDHTCAVFTVNESGTKSAESSTGTNTTAQCFR